MRAILHLDVRDRKSVSCDWLQQLDLLHVIVLEDMLVVKPLDCLILFFRPLYEDGI